MSAGKRPRTVTVISGKGGTGKTSLAASFAMLAKPVVVADCDVDAANLHLVLSPDKKETHEFFALPVARINQELCSACGTCYDLCRFDAISVSDDDPPVYEVEPLACEACMVCREFCPEGAVETVERPAGHWYVSESRAGPMVHARLGIAEENSGKLVTEVRKAAASQAEKNGLDTILVDGPPGIGCAVIASLTAADMVIAVTEASQSGLSDLKRVNDLARHFQMPLLVVINKADLNQEVAKSIKTWVRDSGVELLGELPYDQAVTDAMIQGKAVVECADGALAGAIRETWREIGKRLD